MQIENLLTALDCFNDFEMVFTFPNADESNNKIIEKIEQFINKEKKTRKLVKSLGQSKNTGIY